MTGNTNGTMRHIPEEELHAYLDQALSRQQCVEIESHLAFCPACRAERDGIAALRDRTTALLATLAPPLRLAPPFDTIRQQHAARTSQRQHRLRSITWAASLVAAVGLGWTASRIVSPDLPERLGSIPYASEAAASRPPAPAPRTAGDSSLARALSAAPAVLAAPDSAAAKAPAVARAEAPRRRPAAVRSDVAADSGRAEARVATPGIRAPAFELSTLGQPSTGPDLELDGVWRTMSWAGAKAEAGDALPHLDGLPVVEVQLQGSREDGGRPLMMVAQQLASGEVIRTFEGPVADISQLLAKRTPTNPEPGALLTDSTGGQPSSTASSSGRARTTMAMQRGDRMLAITGTLPADSLRAMIRRLNAEMRTK